MDFSHLAGRHALVTGGGTGIGLAIARALAAEGVQVTITGRRSEILEAAAGQTPGLHPQPFDVSDPEALSQGVAAAIAARGPVTICVANAGIAEGAPFEKMDHALWERTLAINLTGPMLTIRACLPGMRAEGWGRVITISSLAGLKGLRNASAYTASKHGLIGLTRVLSEELLGTGITVNALCPGYVDTPIVARNTEQVSRLTGMSREDAMGTMIRANRHRRLIAPEEVADAAMWLVAAHSGSINGQALEIAGGQA
ncbi:MAG: SDR family NAD(P)-dependent oxidoreductase [Rhodobacteraceae bacterium]|nr:SDR family NAD(P)-dependent oxidoreductase [Paracoccaceae bacterium]